MGYNENSDVMLFREIGRRLGISKDDAKHAYNSGMKKLRRELGIKLEVKLPRSRTEETNG